jgi:hypothetical protein
MHDPCRFETRGFASHLRVRAEGQALSRIAWSEKDTTIDTHNQDCDRVQARCSVIDRPEWGIPPSLFLILGPEFRVNSNHSKSCNSGNPSPGPWCLVIFAAGLNNATGPGLVAYCANRPPKLALLYPQLSTGYLTPKIQNPPRPRTTHPQSPFRPRRSPNLVLFLTLGCRIISFHLHPPCIDVNPCKVPWKNRSSHFSVSRLSSYRIIPENNHCIGHWGPRLQYLYAKSPAQIQSRSISPFRSPYADIHSSLAIPSLDLRI